MIWVILAAGFGVATVIAYALLFRRARQLARQLSDMRAEHNSELVLRALKEAPDHPWQTAAAVNPTNSQEGDLNPSAVNGTWGSAWAAPSPSLAPPPLQHARPYATTPRQGPR